MADTWEEYLDNETGEKKRERVSVQRLSTDAETGEPEVAQRVPVREFQVPRGCPQQQQEKARRKVKPRRKAFHGYLWRKQEVRSNVVKEFLLCRRNVTPIVFMLPTLFICIGWASILCLLGEACMHLWSHKRNWKRKNANVEYRSPLHLISSHFCVHCRSQKWMEKIREIQDKRNLRRRILYPNVVRGRRAQCQPESVH